jgi:Fur family transcriptional regulator, ferric uptake regulator
MPAVKRNTRQKDTLRRIFAEVDQPIGPVELHERAKKTLPQLGLATVYRILKEMVSEGALITVDLPGESSRYEVAGKPHHHHFHCRRCHKVFEVEGCGMGGASTLPKGFVVEDHQVTLYGLCDRCHDSGRARTTRAE